MKKIVLIFLVTCIFMPLRAQFRYSLQGGLNVTTQIARNYNADSARNQLLYGFNVGPSVDYLWVRNFSLHSGIIFENKGTRGHAEAGGIIVDGVSRLLYLDIPLLARWNFRTENLVLFVEAGPYAGIGLTGKAKIKIGDVSSSWDINWGNGSDDHFKRFDYGVTGGGGLEWMRFSLEGCFSFGLANIYSVVQTGYEIEQRAFSVRFGYYLF